MSKQPHRFSEEELAKIAKHFEFKFKRKPCAICGGNLWALHPGLCSIDSLTKELDGVIANRVPELVYLCRNCGQIITVAAKSLGFLELAADSTNPPTQKAD